MNTSDNTPVGVGTAHCDLLTRRQAAAYLGVSEQKLAVWKSKGRYVLPCVKIGRMIRYRRHDLDIFIAQHMQGTDYACFF